MSQQTDTQTIPEVGGWYFDDTGRVLEVTALSPGDELGRDVVGLVSHSPKNGHAPEDYSTDLPTFAAVWRAG